MPLIPWREDFYSRRASMAHGAFAAAGDADRPGRRPTLHGYLAVSRGRDNGLMGPKYERMGDDNMRR